MNKKEQQKLVETICNDLKETLLSKVQHCPEHWDGIELRRWIGDYYNMHYKNLGTFDGKRRKDYNNEMITNVKLS